MKWTLTLSIKVVRRLIMAALIMVVFSHIAYWVADVWSIGIGFVWGIGAALAAFLCRAKAGKTIQTNKQYYLWMSIPAILALIPVILKIRSVLKTEAVSWWSHLWNLAPILISFVIPVVLLWLAYSGLEGYLEVQPTPEKEKA